MKLIFNLFLAIFFSGCVWLQNPDTTAALTDVTAAALSYSQGNTNQTAINGIQGAAALIRSLQTTNKAANPDAVANQASVAGASFIADSVANAASVLTQKGIKPDAVNETIAKVLDAATAKK